MNLWLYHEGLDFSVDLTRMDLTADFLDQMKERSNQALSQVGQLEQGAIANPDENRMVGHYWLRRAELAPSPELRSAIESTLHRIESFAAQIHGQGRFTRLLSIGIGGSALGPQFVSQALGTSKDPMQLAFMDNTDPDGFDQLLEADLSGTLVLVISKSGSTPETLNGMREAQAAFARQGLRFAEQAVAITGDGSVLYKEAKEAGWLDIFPMWDWVGGRTSVMSAVGLLPMALQGLDIRAFLQGAAEMDEWTRTDFGENPALALALSWYRAGQGKGLKDMVILPYKDRLALFSRYLQQLVMESLGKEKDLDGKLVHQGLAVYGNKGSTDQHAYVQQLRDGLNNFFATFVVVLKDRAAGGDSTPGDYLNGFWQGTRQALSENGRLNATISLPEVNARQVGALIALYERTVSLYAYLVNINAYHQPGVEAGKKAAAQVLDLQQRMLSTIESSSEWHSAESLAKSLGADQEAIFLTLRHLAYSRSNLESQGGGQALRVRVRPC
jgi:glucose-6-phosphate isomerase